LAPKSVLILAKVQLKPNSITLSSSKLVGDHLRTSSEPASVMEFGFYPDTMRIKN